MSVPATANAAAVNETPYEAALRALNNHFIPRVNTDFEMFSFRQARQHVGETIDAFHTRLQQMARNCNFPDKDREVKAQLTIGCSSTELRRKILEKPTLTLDQVLNKARALEVAFAQAEKMEKDMEHAALAVQHTNSTRNKQSGPKQQEVRDKQHFPPPEGRSCSFCGGKYHRRLIDCPARFHQCQNCLNLHHFEQCCRSPRRERPSQPGILKSQSKAFHPSSWKAPAQKQVANIDVVVDSESEDEVEVAYQVSTEGIKDSRYEIVINNILLSVIADSGSSVTLLDDVAYSKLGRPTLFPTSVKIFSYGSTQPLSLQGKLEITATFQGRDVRETAYICRGNCGNLLSSSLATRLGLLHMVRATSTRSPNLPPELAKFPKLFQGIGKLKNFTVTLHIDRSVTPVTNTHRRIPLHHRKAVESELQHLVDMDIIEPVVGPTPWVSPVVVTTKPHDSTKIRICVDMKEANKEIQRERHVTPTLDDVLSDLSGATTFSALDLNHGYHQLELDESSRFITTFSTHVGVWRYKRLFFGVNSAAEVFQNAIRLALAGLEGVINVSDDILVWGKSVSEHDRRLNAVLTRLNELGITLNASKCRFRQDRIKFYGFIFSSDGIQADPDKIRAVVSLATPESCDAVRSFLGMANYVRRFVPNFSDITAPLRELTKRDATFHWTADCEDSVNKIKELLANEPILAYFDTNIPSEIVVDASPLGLAAILTQRRNIDDSHVIAFASKSLSPTEQRYSQLEREALAVLWSCQHFHIYIFGQPVTVYTDHKPLVAIFNNSMSHRNTRLERWSLKLVPYNVTVKHTPGATNPADYMSRHPLNSSRDAVATKAAEQHVNFISVSSLPQSISLEEVSKASKTDPVIPKVIASLKSGNWKELKLSPYYKCRDQLAVEGEKMVLLKSNKLCIPQELQERAVRLAHQGHQGESKTKALIRSKVWFPGINSRVEQMIKRCLPCQACTKSHLKEPVIMSPMPPGPWIQLSMDFYSLPTEEKLFVVIDDYSRFPEVHPISSTSAKSTISRLEHIFAQHGVPEVIRADNGPPFNGVEFATYMKKMNIRLRKVTPVWAPANGEVERLMQPLNKMVQTTTLDGLNWKHGLDRFLLSYRATPHSVTGFSPARLLFNREVKTLLPELRSDTTVIQGGHHEIARSRDAELKQKIANHANDKTTRKKSSFKVGDVVLLKNSTGLRNKMTPAYFPQRLTIIRKKGSMISARGPTKDVTRNSSFFKPFNIGDPVGLVGDNPEDDAVDAATRGNDDDPATPIEDAPAPPIDEENTQEDGFHGWQEADNLPPWQPEDNEAPEHDQPQRRGTRRRRPTDKLQYVGKGVQGPAK